MTGLFVSSHIAQILENRTFYQHPIDKMDRNLYIIIFEKDGQHLYAIMLANAGDNRLDQFLIEQIENAYKGMAENVEEKAA